jgi:hypothetical protein
VRRKIGIVVAVVVVLAVGTVTDANLTYDGVTEWSCVARYRGMAHDVSGRVERCRKAGAPVVSCSSVYLWQTAKIATGYTSCMTVGSLRRGAQE